MELRVDVLTMRCAPRDIHSHQVSLGCRNTKTALINSDALDAAHKAVNSVSHVVVVTHLFCVELFWVLAVSPNITATPDTNLRSLDAAA